MLISAVIKHARNQALRALTEDQEPGPVSLRWQYQGVALSLSVRCTACRVVEERCADASSLADAIEREQVALQYLRTDLGCPHAETAEVLLQLLLLADPVDLSP